jgi:hypothetical protein
MAFTLATAGDAAHFIRPQTGELAYGRIGGEEPIPKEAPIGAGDGPKQGRHRGGGDQIVVGQVLAFEDDSIAVDDVRRADEELGPRAHRRIECEMLEVEMSSEKVSQPRLGDGLVPIGADLDGLTRRPDAPRVDESVDQVVHFEIAPESDEALHGIVRVVVDETTPRERGTHRAARGSAQCDQPEPRAPRRTQEMNQGSGGKGGVAAASLASNGNGGDCGHRPSGRSRGTGC